MAPPAPEDAILSSLSWSEKPQARQEGLGSERPGLWVGKIETGELTRITAGVSASPIPASPLTAGGIAYASASWNFDIVNLPIDSQPAQDVLATTRQEFGAVHANAESMIYITDRAGEQEVRLRRMADGTERVIASPRNVPLPLA